MSQEIDLKKGKEMYNLLCEAMKIQEWKYNAHPDDLVINFTVQGEDIPMEFIVAIDPKRELVRLLSRLPFKMSKEHIVDGAIATCQANYNLVDGSFDFDVADGTIDFRMTSSYRESVVSPEMILYMVNYATGAVDDYNDKFLMLSKGAISLADFLKKK